MKNITASVSFLAVLSVVGVSAQSNNTFAQKVVEEIKAAHPEITGLELAAIKAG